MSKVSFLLTSLLIVASFGTTSDAQLNETERVEEYLKQLALDSVLIEHLQEQLNRTVDREQRVSIATRLAGLYSNSVFSGGQDARAQKHYREIIQLSRDFPEIASADLQMTVLHSEYASAESKFLQWIDEGSEDLEKVELAAQFRDIGGRLRGQISKLENSIFEGSDARLFAQASYLYGWVAYYMGVLKPAERGTWMQRSETSFREFLEIDPDKPLDELSVDWFEVQSPWHARAQIGLAMCLRGLGKEEQSKFCFKLLENSSAGPKVRDNLDVWRLNSLVYLGEMDRALKFLQRRTADTEQDVVLRTRLWGAAIESASACRGGLYSKQGVQFLRFGIHGLLSDMNAQVLREVVERESLVLSGDDFLLAWCRGYLDFYRGEKSSNKNDFIMARSELRWAVEAANSSTDPRDISKCQFLLGLIDFQLGDHEAAVESLRQAIPELTDSNSRLAVEAQWLVIRSIQNLARSDSRYANEAFAELDRLVRNFPNSKYVRRVEFEKLLMEVAKFPPDEALRRLKNVQPEDPNYNDAVYHQVLLQHRVWMSLAKSNQPRAIDALQRLLEAEQKLLTLSPLPTIEQRVKGMLVSTDALLRTRGDENESLAREKLKIAGNLVSSLEPTSPLSSELRYYQFQIARIESDLKAMEQKATWFFENVPDGKYTHSVLVGMAQAAQRELELEGEVGAEELSILRFHFGRLSNLLGTETETLLQSQNARYAAAKLSQYHLQAGKARAADELATGLLKAFPNRKEYWLLSTRAKMKLGEFEPALEGWRKIVSAAVPGEDQWFEAKLAIVHCLSVSEPLAAKSLLIQTLRLAPDRPAKWEPEIQKFARALQVSLDDPSGDLD